MINDDIRIIYEDIPQDVDAIYIREINTIVLENSISKLEQSKALKKITDRLNIKNKEFLRSANAETL